jgi:hypothetical protein
MPLVKSSLASDLEKILNQKPSAVSDAAADWAQAYAKYAANALSTASSLPITAMANVGTLTSAFTAAFNTLASQAAGAAMAQGVMAYWQAMVWKGPITVGTTASPGNMSLAGALAGIFSDLSKKTAADKAGELADAFDSGAKLVMVSDVTTTAPPVTTVGPIQ